MRTVYLLLALAAVLAVVKANKLQVKPLVADQTLRAAVKNAESLFNTHIAAVKSATFDQVCNETVDFVELHNDVKNVHMVKGPLIKVSSIKADLEFFNMAVEGGVGNIVVDGNFSISSPSSFNMSPIVSEGSFMYSATSLKMRFAEYPPCSTGLGICGYTGLRVAGDSLLTENYDIDYFPAAVILTVQYQTDHGPVSSQISTSDIDDAVSASIKARLRSSMNRHLKKQLDAVARECSLTELLLHDDTTITRFKSHARFMKVNVNECVDDLLKEIIKRLKNADKGTVSIPAEIHASFSKKILWVKWHGSFTATDAWAKDLTTIRRTGDMSIIYDGGVLTIFGALGFEDLQSGFYHYHAEFMGIGPKGTLRAKVGYNSLFIKVSVDLNVAAHPSATIKELYIEEIDDIDLKVTGLGILTWLLSQIASWEVDFFIVSITSYINKYLQHFANTSISSVNLSNYFQ